ncbi:transposase, IS4 family [Leptospira alexanderi serovar Manhao 3 str. L 60]|uniref:Transposase, IS4 family n=2 Tax=Leptospira TaxID=171 RepID=V6I3P6_9LEPT|nr:transposase, IS4 family [Leptospira alexanderi serovar Manhao 3 str. L 60]
MKPQIISLDKAYSTNAIKSKLKKDKIKYRIPNKKNAKKPEKITPLKPFRWTVELTFTWFNTFRGIKTCWEFKLQNYTALFQLVSALILFRMSQR